MQDRIERIAFITGNVILVIQFATSSIIFHKDVIQKRYQAIIDRNE